MIAEICTDKEGRHLNCRSLGGRIGVSKSTTHQMLKKNRFRSVKESVKPGLTEEMKKARLEFCKAHEHWTLED
jgi:transposase